MLNLLNLFQVARFPCLVEEGLLGAIEAQDREEAFAGNSLQPVLLVTLRLLRSEINVGRAVGIGFGPVHRIDRREETGRWLGPMLFRPVNGDGPEDAGRDVLRQVEPVGFAAGERIAVGIGEGPPDISRPCPPC